MIKINTTTLEAVREVLPKHIRKLAPETLRNLQTQGPVPMPSDLVDLEWWPEIVVDPVFNPNTHKLGDEVLTVNAGDKTVSVTYVVIPLDVDEVQILFDQKKVAKRETFNSHFTSEVHTFLAGTPLVEALSWDKQEQEARGTGTTLLTKIAQARGISVAALKSKIIAKADLWNDFYGPLLGKKQGLEDSIEAATTLAEVEVITWEVV